MKQANGIKLYSTKEVAEMLSVSSHFVLDKIKRGLMPGARIGRGYYVSESSLSDFLNGRTEDKTKPKEKDSEAETEQENNR